MKKLEQGTSKRKVRAPVDTGVRAAHRGQPEMFGGPRKKKRLQTVKKVQPKSVSEALLNDKILRYIFKEFQIWAMLRPRPLKHLMDLMQVSKKWRLIALELPFWEELFGVYMSPVWGYNSLENYLYHVFRYPHSINTFKSRKFAMFGKMLSVISNDESRWWEKLFRFNLPSESTTSSSRPRLFQDILQQVKTLTLYHPWTVFDSPTSWKVYIPLNIAILSNFPDSIKKLHISSRIDNAMLKIIASRFSNVTSLILAQHENEDLKCNLDEGLGQLTDAFSNRSMDHLGLKNIAWDSGVMRCLTILGPTLKTLSLSKMKSHGIAVNLSIVSQLCPQLMGLRIYDCFVKGTLKELYSLQDIELNDLESKLDDLYHFKDADEGELDDWDYLYEEVDPVQPRNVNESEIGSARNFAHPRRLSAWSSEDESDSDMDDGSDFDLFSDSRRGYMRGAQSTSLFDGTSPLEFMNLIQRPDRTESVYQGASNLLRTLVTNNMYSTIQLEDSDDNSQPSASGSRSNGEPSEPKRNMSRKLPKPGSFSLVDACLALPTPVLKQLRRICLWLDPHSILCDEDAHRDLQQYQNPKKGEPSSWAQRKAIELVSLCPNLECLQLSSAYCSGSIRDWCGFDPEVLRFASTSETLSDMQDGDEGKGSSSSNPADVETPPSNVASSSKDPVPNRPRNLFKKSLGVLRTFNPKLEHLEFEIDIERSKYTLIHLKPIICDTKNLPDLRSLKINIFRARLVNYNLMGSCGSEEAAEYMLNDRYEFGAFLKLAAPWKDIRVCPSGSPARSHGAPLRQFQSERKSNRYSLSCADFRHPNGWYFA